MSIPVPDELTPRGPVDSTPPRRPGSIRRTTTIDMTWVGGLGTELRLAGRGRDLFTPAIGSPSVLADQGVAVEVSPERRVLRFGVREEATGAFREVPELVGRSAMGGFRAAVAEQVPELIEAGTPSSLLVDDTPGATLISGFAHSRWIPVERLLAVSKAQGHVRPSMEGICTGFMPGSSSLAPGGTTRWTHRTRAVMPLADDSDAWAWHEAPVIEEVSMRRMRRIDVWAEDGLIRIDSMFQDSATTPEGGRDAVHEYTVSATADRANGKLLEVTPVPRVLPYAECPLATQQVGRLIAVPLAELRAVVLERLAGVAGCTHLNDAVRAMADVPALVGLLEHGAPD
jgi:Protein of unknown function (DUF2889)